MNQYQTDGALLLGPVVAISQISTGERLGVRPENTELFLALSKKYRVRSHSDGWFVDGVRHKTQIWEYGRGRLGVTITGYRMVAKCARLPWLTHGGIGDEEANFNCPWDNEHLERLEKLLGLQRRKQSTRSGC